MTSKQQPSNANPARAHRSWARILLLPALVALGVAVAAGFHLDRYLTFDALVAHRAGLILEVRRNAVLAIVVFAGVYIAAIALSIPGSSILTMSGGFLFGLALGTTIAVIAATAGATLVYLIARTSFGELLKGRALGALERLRSGFQKDAFNYLLFLRLVPLFPFWLINLVAAFLDVPLKTFVPGTFLGIIPGALVYAGIGTGLGHILDEGQRPNLSVLFTPNLLIPILALAALSLVPVLYRHWRRA